MNCYPDRFLLIKIDKVDGEPSRNKFIKIIFFTVTIFKISPLIQFISAQWKKNDFLLMTLLSQTDDTLLIPSFTFTILVYTLLGTCFI